MTEQLAQALSLDRQLVEARRTQRGAEHSLARLLAEMQASQAYLHLGYITLAAYAKAKLELPARRAADLARLGRQLARLPQMDRAVAAGEIDWTKARQIGHLLTPENEAAWIARARTSTVRDLEKDAARSKPGDLPPTGDPEAEPPPEWVDLTFRFSVAEADAVIQSLARARAQGGFTREEVADGTLIAAMATSGREEGDDSVPPPTGERYRTVIHHCEKCRKSEGGSDTDRLEAMCDSEVIDMRPGPNQGTAIRRISSAMRWKVLYRAGWKCEVPDCHNKFWLDIHHIDGWAQTKRHDFARLAAVCCAHHRAVHNGYLGLTLTAEGAVAVAHGDGRAVVGPVRVVVEQAQIARAATRRKGRRRYLASLGGAEPGACPGRDDVNGVPAAVPGGAG